MGIHLRIHADVQENYHGDITVSSDGIFICLFNKDEGGDDGDGDNEPEDDPDPDPSDELVKEFNKELESVTPNQFV